MKIILTGTRHDKDDEEIEVILTYENDDVWTIEVDKINFSISDLTTAMDFLKREY